VRVCRVLVSVDCECVSVFERVCGVCVRARSVWEGVEGVEACVRAWMVRV